jgi:ribosomal protein S18 acetylase RimI-like enzyme
MVASVGDGRSQSLQKRSRLAAIENKGKMKEKILFGTGHIVWREALALLEHRIAPHENDRSAKKACEKIKTAFENSYIVCTIYHDDQLVGICRALSDGVRQSAIYDLNVASNYRNKGIGYKLMTAILSKLPCGPIILFAVPGKASYYRKFGFKNLRTGMGLFPDEAKRLVEGYIR